MGATVVCAKDSTVDDLISNLKQKQNSGRIRYLNYVLGNEPVLLDQPDSLARFIGVLDQMKRSESDLMSAYIDFYKSTYPNIIEKNVPKRLSLMVEQLKRIDIDSRFYAILQHQLGTNYFVNEEFPEAFKYLIPAHEAFKKIGWENLPEGGVYLHDMALAYFTVAEYSKVIECMRASFNLAPYSINLDIQRYNNMAAAFDQLGQVDSARKYYQDLTQVAIDYNDSFWVVKSKLSNANLVTNPSDFEQAWASLEQAQVYLPYQLDYDKQLTTDLDCLYWSVKIAQLNLLIRFDKLNEAAPLARELATITDLKQKQIFRWHQRNQVFLFELYRALDRYYAKVGDFKSAYFAAKQFNALEKEINEYASANLIKMSEAHLTIVNNKLELQKLISNRKLNYGIILILSLGVVLVFVLYQLMKSRKEKAHALIENKNLDLEHQLALNNKALANYVQNIRNKNEIIENISLELEKMGASPQGKNNNEDIQSKLDELRNYRILTNEDWLTFQKLFDKVNRQFSEQLLQLEPKLTEGEMRYLMLSSLNMDNRDMAASLGISADSLRVTWSRLKKKFSHVPLDNAKQLVQMIEKNEL